MKLLPVPGRSHIYGNETIIDTECPWCGVPLKITLRFGVMNKRAENRPGVRRTVAAGWRCVSGYHDCVDPTTLKEH